MAATPDQEHQFVVVINAAVEAIGISAEDAAALLIGSACEVATKAWGIKDAARMLYIASLRLAQQAGLGTPPGAPPPAAAPRVH